ncbi:MAG: histidinol dehydrogenase [Phycisphaerae bacterium]|jgi:histidinol dehydrogenase|nr:MAG: histidinol dehydrogenase [Phycisphaerae bacterium]
MIPLFQLSDPSDNIRIEQIIARLRLDPREMALARGHRAQITSQVQAILQQVADHGDSALVEIARKFDDPDFSRQQLRVTPEEMEQAAQRIDPQLRAALKRAVTQVREYQTHVRPVQKEPLTRDGLKMGMKWTALDSVGLYFPGGKAAYPSSLIMLAVPAMVAGVKRVIVMTPASRFGKSDVVLAAAYEVGVTEMYRVGGAAAIGAMAFGTQTIRPVDKIVGPGNTYVQIAKRLVSGCVGIDGYLGPSEILTLADESADPRLIASDLLAQAEHDPGSCFLLTTSSSLAQLVIEQIKEQLGSLQRVEPIKRALQNDSMIVVDGSMDRLIELANRIACEHVNLQTKDNSFVLEQLRHAGAVYVGVYSPVAAGDYIAGPSHCLPTNTTARFSSGISPYEFMKRTSVVEYDLPTIRADAPFIIQLAQAEQLDGHAMSVWHRIRTS